MDHRRASGKVLLMELNAPIESRREVVFDGVAESWACAEEISCLRFFWKAVVVMGKSIIHKEQEFKAVVDFPFAAVF